MHGELFIALSRYLSTSSIQVSLSVWYPLLKDVTHVLVVQDVILDLSCSLK